MPKINSIEVGDTVVWLDNRLIQDEANSIFLAQAISKVLADDRIAESTKKELTEFNWVEVFPYGVAQTISDIADTQVITAIKLVRYMMEEKFSLIVYKLLVEAFQTTCFSIHYE